MLKDIIKLIPNYDPFKNAEEYYFDEVKAQRALDFFKVHLKFVRGQKAGKPFKLEPWQQAIVANLFGWYKKEDNLRRYKSTLLFLSRKNGKSFLVAGVLAYILFCLNEPAAQVYSAAADRKSVV